MSAKGVIWSDTPGVGRGVSSIGRTEGESDRSRACHAGSCAHDVVDTTEVCGVAGGGLYQGEECDSYSTELSGKTKELCRAAFLGPGLMDVSTVGRDEQVIRAYIRHQEREDRRIDQLTLV